MRVGEGRGVAGLRSHYIDEDGRGMGGGWEWSGEGYGGEL